MPETKLRDYAYLPCTKEESKVELSNVSRNEPHVADLQPGLPKSQGASPRRPKPS